MQPLHVSILKCELCTNLAIWSSSIVNTIVLKPYTETKHFTGNYYSWDCETNQFWSLSDWYCRHQKTLVFFFFVFFCMLVCSKYHALQSAFQALIVNHRSLEIYKMEFAIPYYLTVLCSEVQLIWRLILK